MRACTSKLCPIRKYTCVLVSWLCGVWGSHPWFAERAGVWCPCSPVTCFNSAAADIMECEVSGTPSPPPPRVIRLRLQRPSSADMSYAATALVMERRGGRHQGRKEIGAINSAGEMKASLGDTSPFPGLSQRTQNVHFSFCVLGRNLECENSMGPWVSPRCWTGREVRGERLACQALCLQM